MAEERDQFARWAKPTSIQRADLIPVGERAEQRGFRAWRRYNTMGDRSELVELGVQPVEPIAMPTVLN